MKRKTTAPTAQEIIDRCDEVGDCLMWTGRMANGSPLIFDCAARRYVQARRVVFESTGETIPAGKYPVMKCRQKGCLLRDHMQLLTTKQIGALAAKERKFSTPARRAAVSAGIRAKNHTKITIEIAREIRTKEMSQRAYAKKFGVHRSVISRIQANVYWREHVKGASVFNLC